MDETTTRMLDSYANLITGMVESSAAYSQYPEYIRRLAPVVSWLDQHHADSWVADADARIGVILREGGIM
jgi:hypothetical protein